MPIKYAIQHAMQRFTFLIIPSLIAVALFTGISSFESTTFETTPEADLAQPDFDAYAEGISSVLYDAGGAVNYTLEADRQVHLKDDSTEFENPFIRLFREGDSHWNIVADSGRISAAQTANDTENQTIELSGNVEVFSLDESGNRTVMTTGFLSVDPQRETLETDRAVTLVTTNLRQSSTGMFADLKIDQIIFHRDIQGSYEQPPD